MKLRIQVDLQTFDVEVGDLNARPVRVRVDGDTFEVWPEEPAALPQSAAALVRPPALSLTPTTQPAPAITGDRARVVLAPIPGVILAVSVRPGDQVTYGQELCVLEAMKMKNLIRASRAGTIAAVLVVPGDQVRQGQVLVEYNN